LRCSRCNVYVAEYGGMCGSCHLAKSLIPTYNDNASDEEIIDKSMLLLIFNGCRECGSKDFAYQAGIAYEGQLKYYMAEIDCAVCENRYSELMEVRINESIEDEADTPDIDGGETRYGEDE